MNENNQIDPYKYGKLVATVESLEKKVDKLEAGMEELLQLANQSRGGLWAGMAVVATVSSVITFITGWWGSK
jgi:Mg2+ and Co2+ transporter CorA